MKNSIAKKTAFILGILFIFIVWIIGEAVKDNSYIFPSVSDTFDALVDLFTEPNIYKHTYKVLGYTLLRLTISVVGCFVLGTILALLAYRFKAIKWFFKPSISLFKTLPIAVVIILLWVLSKDFAPYYIVSVVVLPVVYEAVLIGLENISSDILDEVKLNCGITPKVIFKVLLPIVFPAILTALIQSIGLGLKVLVMAEYIMQTEYSIGNEFIYYKEISMEMEYLYAWSIILIIFVLLFEIIISYISKKKDLVL